MVETFRYRNLRSLRPEDAQGMLRWMHHPETAECFRQNFDSMSESDVLDFIQKSYDRSESLHLAITGSDDTYLGTISLKHIDNNFSGEYAISMAPEAKGTGAAEQATESLLDYAFCELGLHRVYLNVRRNNSRAIRFYEKIGFTLEGTARDALRTAEGYVDLLWFSMLKPEWDRKSNSF